MGDEGEYVQLVARFEADGVEFEVRAESIETLVENVRRLLNETEVEKRQREGPWKVRF